MKRVTQKTSSYCGPAVLEMLCSFLGVYLNQDEVVEALNAHDKIDVYGILVPEMGRVISQLAPELSFWFKENSSLTDLSQIVRTYGFPVGIEWQGVFYEDADEDNGHYSIVTHIDTINNLIMLSDPYRRFAGTDRIFHVLEFEHRWWDENEVTDFSGRKTLVRDEKMMFIITPKNASFPELLGMVKS